MNTTEKRILSYPHLPRDEQREVESYVEDHPEWAPLLRDVRKLEELAQQAGVSDVSTVGPDLLATYVVAQYLGVGGGPAATGDASGLTASFQRIEEALESDPDLREQAEAMRRRIRDVESEVDPVAHFESLTGHRLSDFDVSGFDPDLDPDLDNAKAQESASLQEVVDNGAMNEDGEPGGRAGDYAGHQAADRAAQAPDRDGAAGRVTRNTRWVAAAAAILVAAYGVLYLVSWSSQSELDRLATVDINDDVIESYETRVRSPLPPEAREDTTADDLYLKALPLLRNARTSTLGLFPHFDHRKLREAESLLERVVKQTEAGSFLQLEAYFYLGKVNLAQGEVETARSNFKTVVEREGRRATEAYQILRRLEEEYPMRSTRGNT